MLEKQAAEKKEEVRKEEVKEGNVDACRLPESKNDPKCQELLANEAVVEKAKTERDPLKRIDEAGAELR